MKTKRYLLGLSALAVTLLVGAGTASAYQGDYTKTGPNYSGDRHEAMTQAFSTNDYNAWKELMAGRGRVSSVINETNFPLFAKAHNLAQSGDYEGADAIRQELGLRTRDGERVGAGYRGGNGNGTGTRYGAHRQAKN